MIRPQAVLDLRKLDNLAAFARNHAKIVGQVAGEAFREKSPDLLRALRREGLRRAVHPFQWSDDPAANARAAAWYAIAIREGRIKVDAYGYIRTGALTDAYDVSVITTQNGEITAFVRNKANRAYRYTIGKRQVPGHATTGWGKDEPIIADWTVQYRQYLISQLNAKRVVVGV